MATATQSTSAIESGTELRQLVNLAGRITYGVNRQFIEIAESLGYAGFLEWQLDHESIDDGGLEDLLASFLPTLTMNADELSDYIFEQENFGAAQRDLTIATMIRQIYSPRQLFERMVEFWGDHFNVPMNSVVSAYFKTLEDRSVMRPLAMGQFEDLLLADAKSPAMLYYLDNYTSTAEGPNENYAREMLELHTLGVNGGYTEDDIKETARVLTGWSIRQPASFFFRPGFHDNGTKTVLGTTFQSSGVSEGEQLLSMIAGHESTARHIATKLAQRFVADLPETDVVDAVAQSFTDSAGDIRETLRTLLMHPQVVQTMPLKLKRPNEFGAAVLRGLETELDERVLTGFYDALSEGGHLPFSWPAPDGYPDQREYWQSTNGFLMRFNRASAWASEQAGLSPVLIEAAQAASLNDQLDILERALKPQGLGVEERQQLMRYARRLPVSQRAGALATWMLAGPDAQWR